MPKITKTARNGNSITTSCCSMPSAFAIRAKLLNISQLVNQVNKSSLKLGILSNCQPPKILARKVNHPHQGTIAVKAYPEAPTCRYRWLLSADTNAPRSSQGMPIPKTSHRNEFWISPPSESRIKFLP